ncbi:MAG: PAS domain-containing protein [Alphaproteobacteria bacterium]|nr:PAS domain-containing protein [Alphaproteobacteria bacterium]
MLFVLPGLPAAAEPQVLLLQSYHAGTSWTDGIAAGVRDGFDDRPVDLWIEYLDSRRRPLAAIAEPMAAYLRAKYAATPPDIIIASDNNALTFLQRHRASTFPDIPLVFTGINHFRPALIAGLEDRTTGVVENSDAPGTVGHILHLRPQTRRLIVITGETTTGRAIRAELQAVLPAMADDIAVAWWDGLSMDELLGRLATLGDTDAVLLGLFYRDGAGHDYGYRRGARLIAEAAAAPVFALWDFQVGTGVVGGRVVESRRLGEAAARLAGDVLNGADPALIPIDRAPMVADRFDAEALDRFDIARDRLPAGSIVINADESWLAEHWRTVTGVLALLVAEGVALAALTWLLLRQRRRAEAESRLLNERLTLATRSAGIGVWDFDIRMDRLVWDDRMFSLYGVSRADFAGAYEAWRNGVHPDDRARAETAVERAIRGEAVFDTAFRVVHPDGAVRWIRAFADITRDRHGRPERLIGVNFDITGRVEADEELHRRNALLTEKTELLQAAERLARMGSWEWDITGDHWNFSEGWRAIHGTGASPLTSEELKRIAYPEDLPLVEAAFEKARSGDTYDIQHRIIDQSTGLVRYIRAYGRLVGKTGGRAGKLVGAAVDITELKDAEAKLGEKVLDLTLAQRIARIGNWTLDPAIGVPVWSDSVYEIYERDRELGPPTLADYRRIYKGEHFEMFWEAIRAAIDHGTPYDITLKLELPDGRTKWINAICQPDPERGPAGHVLHGTIQDITERKRMETALAVSERRFRDIAETMSDWIWETDHDLRYTYLTPNVVDVLGYTAEELLGRSALSFIVDPPPDTVGAVVAELTACGAPIENLENWVRTKNGRLVCLSTSGVPIRDESGTVIGWRGMDKDITARKRLKEDLALRDRALEAAANGVLITRADGDQPIVYCNKAFERITGYPAEETLGRNCRFLQAGDTDQAVLAEMKAAFREHRFFKGLLRNYRKDGTMFWNQCSIAPVFDDQGRVSHYIGIQEDVTERQRQHRELLAAKEQAEAANAAKSHFLATMSHELRTPLNAINGFSEIMERQFFGPLGNPHYEGYVHDIRSSGEYLLSLINDLLDMSKIEAGRMALNCESLSLDEAVSGVLDLLAGRAEAHGLIVRLALRPHLPNLLADQRAVVQMLENLLSNAIKFTPAGGIITISSARTPEGGLSVAVSDTGPGIPADHLERVLQPFEQAEAGMTRQHQGAGLGLALVKSLIELHGGGIALESTVGVGTTVTLTFPAERVGTREAA